MNRPRILFVDDEPFLLKALQNLFRTMRREWDMVFVAGGEAALAEMAKAPVDVIVSDMRMPGMDGATLLARVRDAYPNTIRIILSGHAEGEALKRAMANAHLFLAKPYDGDLLKNVVERALRGEPLSG